MLEMNKQGGSYHPIVKVGYKMNKKISKICVVLFAIVFIVNIFTMISNNEIKAEESGLVAYWSFDDSSNLGYDDSGNGNNGVNHGAIFSSDSKKGGSLEFDDIGDYMSIGSTSSLGLTDTMTVAFWIKINGPGTDKSVKIFGNEPVWEEYGDLSIFIHDDTFDDGYKFFSGNNQRTGIEFTTDIMDHSWHHIVVSHSENNVKLYIDGELNNRANNFYSFSANTESLEIGTDIEGYESIDGRIDELYIYDRILSSAEIQNLYEIHESVPTEGIYQCALTIKNHISKDLTDYQLKIELTNDEILANLKSDGSDLRFFETQTTNPYGTPYAGLPYWIEPIEDGTDKIVVWIKTSLSSNADKTIYMYYGKDGVTSESDGDAVFEFFDPCDNLDDWIYTSKEGKYCPTDNYYKSLEFSLDSSISYVFTSYFEDLGSEYVQWNWHGRQGFFVSSTVPVEYSTIGSAQIAQDYGGGNSPGGIEYGLNEDMERNLKTSHPTYNTLYKYEITKQETSWYFNCIRLADNSNLLYGIKQGTIGIVQYIGWHLFNPTISENYVGKFGNGIHFRSRQLDSSAYNMVDVVYYGMHVRKYTSSEPNVSFGNIYTIDEKSPLESDENKPNFSIKNDDISFTDQNPSVGDEITIYAKVSNIGEISGSVLVKFYDGNPNSDKYPASLIESKVIALSYGEYYLVSVDWTVVGEGSHDIYVEISDINNNETDVNDNKAYSSLFVGDGGESLLVVTVDNTGISKFDPGSTRTLTAKVYCYNSSVENVELRILDNDNLSVTVKTPSIDMNPEEQRDFLLTIEVPELSNDTKYKTNNLVIQAVGDNDISSNAEPIEIIISDTDDVPGFSTIAIVTATSLGALVAFFRRRH